MVEVGSQRLLVPEGSAMLVRVPGNHVYRVDPETGNWDFVYAVLHGSEALRLVHHATSDGSVIRWDANGPAEQQLFRLVEELRRPDRASAYELSARTYALAMALFDQGDAETGARSGVARSLRYLRENLASPLNVTELAGVAGYSRHHFTRIFRRETGLAPVRYLREARCERAAQLLATETLSVKEIAARCGFESTSYFCRVFHQTTGFSPGQYRVSRP
jgi:AraC-like DNA-binding protein